MRMKTTVLIILVVFATTASTFFSGLYFTESSLEDTIEQDLEFAIGIANSLISTQMKLMKNKAGTVAVRLAAAGTDEELSELIVEQFNEYPDISALSVFNREGIIASYSIPPHEHDLTMHSDYIEMVYGGASVVTSPFYCSARGEYVLNVYTHMGGGRILSATMPGPTFSDMLSRHRLWETGNIFMLNEEGTFIGAADEEIVLAMNSYIEASMENPERDDGELTGLIYKILSSDKGVEQYRFGGVDRMCAYSLIDESMLGWRVAVTVPFNESPQADALAGQLYAAVFFLTVGIGSAVFLSRLVARPYKKIEEQNRDLENMVEEIAHRDKLLDASHRVSFTLFDTAEDSDIGSLLVESLELLSRCAGADQAYITQNELVDGVPYFTCKSSWVKADSGVISAILPGMRFPWGLDQDWDERFNRGECMNGPVAELPEAVRGFFAPFDTSSVLVIPVFVHERFWGLVGFSDSRLSRYFGGDDVDILCSMSLMMAAAINRSEQDSQLREAHSRIRLLINSTPLGFNLCNREFQNIETNDTAVNLFGLSSQAEYLERFFDLMPEYQPDGRRSREAAREHLEAAFTEGCRRFEWMHQKLDGTPIPSEITLVCLDFGGEHLVAGYIRDLREHKRMLAEIEQRDRELQAALADAEEANSAKSDFLAHMSHEIRTPLNAVVGLSELVLDADGLEAETEDKLEKIHDSGLTILSIVNDILDISKIESGRFELNPIQYDTPSLINDAVTLNIVRIGEKDISFKIDIDENLPGTLYGDDLRVKQIFNNLLSNAFKYTHSGTVEWRVTFERDGEDVWLVTSVKDTGIGIKPKDLEKLFSAYNQVDRKTNRKVEGTGLGLAITKRLAEMMDGEIRVESEYGKGTEFHVRLRQAAVPCAPIGKEIAGNLMDMRYSLAKRGRTTKLVRANLSYASVLIVDDIATNLDVVKGMMKPYSMKIDCASSGPQAIELIQAENPRYNAVFMDHMMPGMDGVEATRIIREELGTDYARNIPIIALTANALVGNEEMFLQRGFQAFISKPIDMLKLDYILRQWVRDKALETELWSGEPHEREAAGSGSAPGGITVRGLDMERAFESFGGDGSILTDVLRSYTTNTPALLTGLSDYLAAENLPDYAIVVHGIKGSSYGIMAQEAGKAAEALEKAAKAGELDAVKAGHTALRQLVETLIADIRQALDILAPADTAPTAAEPDRALLQELREACGAFDMDRVDAVMERLEAFRYERKAALIPWLRGQIDKMAFEKIAEGKWLS